MSDTRQASRWVEETGAEEVFMDRATAKRTALSLLRAWRRYKKTGLCPWTGEELYDYTCFLHAFAHRCAGDDDDLYHWLTSGGFKILDSWKAPESPPAPNRLCPLCGRLLTTRNTAKTGMGDWLTSAQGNAWCQGCSQDARLKKIVGGSG